MKKLFLLLSFLCISTAFAAGDVAVGPSGDPNAGLSPEPPQPPIQPPSQPVMQPKPVTAGIYDLGGRKLIDRTVEITGGLQVDKYIEQVGISTPTTPATGHARIWLSSATHTYCQIFDDGTQTCQGAGNNIANYFPVSLSTGIVYSLPLPNGGIGIGLSCAGTDDSTAFTTADHTKGVGYIIVPSSNCVLNTSISLTKALFFPADTLITVNSGKTLTLSSAPIAAVNTIFSGTVNITQTNADVYAEWWGAKPKTSTTAETDPDSAAAFQSADTALSNGGTIRAKAGHYRMKSTVTFSHANLIGDGRWATVFEPGNAMVAYSSMTMFSWNNHYAHYESFQVNGIVISTFTVFLSSNAAGGEHVHDIQMVNVGIGFNVPVNNGAHWTDVFINGCSSGVYTGGNKGLFAGDIYFDDFTIVPYNNGYGFIADKNSSAFYIRELTILGGIGGFWEALTSGVLSGNDAKVSNMIFHHPLINAQSSFGVRIDAGLYTTMDDNPIINGITSGPAFSVNPSTPAYVDGLEIDNALVNGNGTYGIDFGGCNLSIIGGNWFANTNVGVHINNGACGLVKLDSLMAGTTIWSNAANGQAYGVQILAGALQNKTNPDTGNVFTGRLQMTNLLLGGNATAPYQDLSTIADSRKLISNIQTDLGPNFSYGNNSTAGVFTSSINVQYEIMQGSTYTIGQTGETARFRAGTTQNLVTTGAQALASGSSLLSLNDNNTLAPLQLRGNKLYWASGDGNVGIGNTTPATLVNISSGILTVDGSGNGVIIGNGALASGDLFRVVSGSATVDGILHVGITAPISNTCLTATACTVTCTAGTYVLGGGCQGSNAATALAGFPNTSTTFACTSGASQTVVAWAICGRLKS